MKNQGFRAKRFIFLSIIVLISFFSINIVHYNREVVQSSDFIIYKSEIKNVTLIFKHELLNLTLSNFTINSNESSITVFEAMIEELGGEQNLDYYTAVNGVFIKNIKVNGTWYNQTYYKFWLFYVNSVPGHKSCSECLLESNDEILWLYTDKSPFQTNEEDYNYEFIIFIIICGSVIGGLGVLGVFLKMRKH